MIPGGERLLWCPTSGALRDVMKEFTAKDLERGRVSVDKVKSIVAGCGVSEERFLLGRKPKADRKTVTSKDGQKFHVIKGVGGRRIILMN